MTGADLLAEAVAELYAADPAEFVRRRQELAGAARSAGQAPAARQIAALRKPTRAAWTLNRLARSDPDAVSRLAGLGDELRAAERSGDGDRLRELARERRQLVATLVRRALEVSGQPSAPAALREEITVTLAAALADPEIAAEIERGTLHRAEQRAAFGPAQGPGLSVVPAPSSRPRPGPAREGKAREIESGRAQAPQRQGRPRPAKPESAAVERRAVRAARAEQAAAEARAAEERRLAQVRAQVERALADADQAVAAAAREQQELQTVIRRLEGELADARRRLREAGADARRAQAARDRARQAVDRLPADHARRR